jgi:hypothetical protein
MKQNLFFIMALAVAVAMMMLTGCSIGGQSDARFESKLVIDPVIKKSGSYDSFHGPIYDVTGQVEVYYYYKSAFGNGCSATAIVPDDSITLCIGGGAFTDMVSGEPSEFLTGSWPGTDFRSWNAQSKHHIYNGSHRLVACAIGMRLKDNNRNYIPVSTLKNQYFFISSSKASGNGSYTTTTTSPSTGYALLSGGTQNSSLYSIDSLDTQMLGRSQGYVPGVCWQSLLASHKYQSQINSITSYAVLYNNKSIPGFGYLNVQCLKGHYNTTAGNRSNNWLFPTSGWVISGVGGQTSSTPLDVSTGRLITSLGIFNAGQMGVFISDNDFYTIPYSGTTDLQLFQIQRAVIPM